ncbi:MAG: septum site-determining protein MinD [Clostridiales bacterium]|nr:septum site-determining protein MinD [Clostridiales bacterium]
MGKIVMVASGKGGTGKTTATANIGAALALRGHLTAVIDMDIGLRNLDVALGLESNIVYDVAEAIEGTCSLDDVLIKDTRFENLYFAASPQTRSSIDANEERLREFWDNVRNRFEYCIVDAPAGISGGFSYVIDSADCAVIVTLPETASLRDGDRVISIMEQKGIEDIRMVINRVRPSMIERGIMMDADRCMDMLGVKMLGIVPDDEELIISNLRAELAISNPNSAAGRAFLNIAARLCGEEIPIMDISDKMGFFKRLGFLFGGGRNL